MRRGTAHAARAVGATLALVGVLAACGGAGGLGEDPPVRCRATVVPSEGRPAETVAWILSPDSDDHPLSDRWCAGVGPAVAYSPAPARSSAVTANGDADQPVTVPPEDEGVPAWYRLAQLGAAVDSIAVVTWNLHIGGGDLPALVRDLREGRLTGGEPVRDFVLLLQEAHRSGGGVPQDRDLPDWVESGSAVRAAPADGERRDVVALAEALGLHLLYAPSMRNGIGAPGPPEDRGNAILSTIPMTDPRAIELPQGIQRRVALLATLTGLTGANRLWRLDVSNVHLDNASLSHPIGSFGDIRTRQVDGLLRALPDRHPTVVGGDFNTWWAQDRAAAIRLMRTRFVLGEDWDGQATATRLGRERILDWLFFSGPPEWGFRSRRIDSRYGSDHHPLLGWVRMEPAPR